MTLSKQILYARYAANMHDTDDFKERLESIKKILNRSEGSEVQTKVPHRMS